MARVITFSRTFPGHHPRYKEETGFIEKMHNGEKKHTIRNAKYSWKPGDLFNPRYWTGNPYRSPQGFISGRFNHWKVKKVWQIYMRLPIEYEPCEKIDDVIVPKLYISRENALLDSGHKIYVHYRNDLLIRIAENDGLSLIDFINWFTFPFQGTIICWDDSVKYQ